MSWAPAQMSKDTPFQKEQERLMRMKRLKWYILDPQSLPVQCWDAMTAIAASTCLNSSDAVPVGEGTTWMSAIIDGVAVVCVTNSL